MSRHFMSSTLRTIVGSFVGGIAASVGCAAFVGFFFGGGRERFDRWRYAGSADGGGLLRPSGSTTTTDGASITQSIGRVGAYGT